MSRDIYGVFALGQNTGQSLTTEELEAYAKYREERRIAANDWYAKNRAKHDDGTTLEDIKRRRHEGLPLTPEETSALQAAANQ